MWKNALDHLSCAMSATLLPSPCKRTTGRPSPPPRRPLHALCKECDGRKPANNNHHSGFNPRTPCRVRLQAAMCDVLRLPFQSTRTPCGVRLKDNESPAWAFYVSIHALLAECDRPRKSLQVFAPGFNPRTPCGVRPGNPDTRLPDCLFQSTHSLRSATGGRLSYI